MPETRRVVLTGATRGLGRAMAARFAEQGHTVLGCGRDVAAVAEVQKQLGSPHGVAVVDVRDDSAVRAWAVRVLEKHGPPDLLINNAAVINRSVPLWDVSAEEFDRVIAINISGVANCVRHFVPAMVQRRKGVIVNFSSGWGRSVSPRVAPYCATKFAIEGLTQALAEELPEGMAAVPLNPGIIDTAMLRSCFGEGAKNYRDPDTWSRTAVPFLLKLSTKDNGRSLDAP